MLDQIYQKQLKVVGISWAVCLILFAAVYAVFLLPQKKTRADVETRLAVVKNELASAEKAVLKQSRDQLKKQVSRIAAELGEYSIDADMFSNLTFDISQIAKKQGVNSALDIKTKRAGLDRSANSDKKVSENELHISFDASFHQFAKLLNALERHVPVVFVDGFKVARSAGQEGLYKVQMQLSVFTAAGSGQGYASGN